MNFLKIYVLLKCSLLVKVKTHFWRKHPRSNQTKKYQPSTREGDGRFRLNMLRPFFTILRRNPK